MTENQVIEKLTTIFQKVFKKNDIQITREMTAADVNGWDSLSHVEMIANVEKEFSIKFKMKDVIKMKNVGDLIDTIIKYQQA